MGFTSSKHIMTKAGAHTSTWVIIGTVLTATAVFIIISMAHASSAANAKNSETTTGNQTNSSDFNSNMGEQAAADSKSTTSPSSSDLQNPGVNLTVNGQPVDVPENGSTHQTVKNEGGSQTDVNVHSTSKTKTTVRNSSSSSVNVNVSTTNTSNGSSSDSDSNNNGMPPMPAMPPMP